MNADLVEKTDQIPGENPMTTPPLSYRSRRPLFAALMSMFLPGFGQLYNGQLNRAIWIYLVFCLFAVPGIAFLALYAPPAMIGFVLALGLCLTLGLWIFGIVDAWLWAKRLNRFRLRQWQTSGLYASVFVVCNLLILPLTINWVAEHQVRAFKIPSGSMTPSILEGDYLFADMRYNCPGCRGEVARGDAAVFVYPNNRNRYYIKRILGLPGDQIEVSSNQVLINGQALSASSATTDKEAFESFEDKSWQVQWGETSAPAFLTTVTAGHVFVLGDNRSESTDSRQFGLVPLSDLVGRARQVWMSFGENGIRWGRIGLSL